MLKASTPPPLQMEFDTQGFETPPPPPPPPLQMETKSQGFMLSPPPLRMQEQPSLPLPPRLRMAGMQEHTEISKPQENFYPQIQLDQAPSLAANTIQMDIEQQQQLPSHALPADQQGQLQIMPRPVGTQQPVLQVPTLPPPNKRRGAAVAAPILASMNPNNQITGPTPWATTLCGFHNDLRNCLVTCCCPCVTFGEISEIIDKGSSTCMMNGLIYALLRGVCGCACIYSCTYRDRIRRQFNLEGSNCGDFCIHLCCEPCALCQEYRELKAQGFDLSRGWDANLELRAQGVLMPPTTSMGMRR